MNEEQGKFLEELYHANFKRMLLELYPILKDMPSAQVAIQEAARIACQKPEEMMSSPNPAGWLRKTAGLVAKNMLREQARQKRTFLPLEGLLPESEPSEWDDSDRELVQLCLDVVSEEDFTLFRRVTLDGWTYVDAAKAAVGNSPMTIRRVRSIVINRFFISDLHKSREDTPSTRCIPPSARLIQLWGMLNGQKRRAVCRLGTLPFFLTDLT